MTIDSAQFRAETASDGRFVRQANAFTERVTADGSSGYPAVPGRYHLYVSRACPWAQRTMIVRRLKGLEDVISMSVVDPIRDERGWAFREGEGHGPDPINGFDFLSEAYLATDPSYQGRHTVPVLWDIEQGRIVSNDFPQITIQLDTEFDAYASFNLRLYPGHLRDEIDAVNDRVYRNVNNGVYRAGFATTQAAYEEAFDDVFATLDWLDRRLATRRYLVGGQLTGADIRLFTTLVRFDTVYFSHFKCNLRRLVDHPNLWPYTRDLFQRPGFGDTTDFDHIKRHYFGTHHRINPTGIVPKGPAIDWWQPHDRDRLEVEPGGA
jgi:glutathionyl-hydroquinone reductase